MAKIELFVTPRRQIIPAAAEDLEILRVMRPWTTIEGRTFAPRNVAHHRKYRAMLAFVAAHHETLTDPEAVALVLKFHAGFGRAIVVDGRPVFEPKSTAFDSCDQVEFDGYYRKCLDLLFTVFYPDVADVHREMFLEEALRFSQ